MASGDGEELDVGMRNSSGEPSDSDMRGERDALSSLLELIQAVSSSLELGEVLRMTAKGITAAVGAPGCGIYLMDELTGLLVPHQGRAASALPQAAVEAFMSRPFDPSRD